MALGRQAWSDQLGVFYLVLLSRVRNIRSAWGKLRGMNRCYVVCGRPGAGKTTYGRKLALERKAVFLDIDTVTEIVVRAGIRAAGNDPDDRDSLWFKHHFRQPIYDTLFAIAKENLAMHDVVVVGPFSKEIQVEDWPRKLEAQLGYPVEIYYVTVDEEVRRRRIIARGEPRDLAKIKDWDNHQQYFAADDRPVFQHVLIKND